MEIENLSEIKAKVEEMFKNVEIYSDLVSSFKKRLEGSLDYSEATALVNELLSHGFLYSEKAAKEVQVSLISTKSRYNANRIWSEVNFERRDSEISYSSIQLAGLILKTVRQAIEDKTKELAASEGSVEETCLKQVQLEKKLIKFHTWWYLGGITIKSVVDWETTPDTLQDTMFIWDRTIDETNVYTKIMEQLDREIVCCTSGRNQEGNYSDISNNWDDKDTIPFMCKNLLEFVSYL